MNINLHSLACIILTAVLCAFYLMLNPHSTRLRLPMYDDSEMTATQFSPICILYKYNCCIIYINIATVAVCHAYAVSITLFADCFIVYGYNFLHCNLFILIKFERSLNYLLFIKREYGVK